MKRSLKNILMIILVLGFSALVYLTIEVANGNISLINKKIISLEASAVIFNEQAGVSSETAPDPGNEELNNRSH
jgi:hypothetical protein